MTFTSHGHYIPGTPVTNDPPENRARCGGVKICRKCNEEAVTVLEAQLKKLREETESNKAMLTAETFGIPFSSKDEGVDFQLRAKRLVREEYNSHRSFEQGTIDLDEIYVVWFTYTLGNWKAILSTSLPNGRIYEVTHRAGEATYVDTYLKLKNTEYKENKND